MADYELSQYFDLDELMKAPNIVPMLSGDDLTHIGNCAMEGYEEDKSTRSEWEKRTADSLKLALQVVEQKTFPWTGAANVKFPLITVAALQYAARAYPALIDGTDLVKCKVYGEDPDGQKTQRAERIGTHMSWQNLEQDTCWEEEHDKLLLTQAIVGDAFVKKVFNPGCAHNVTQLVLPSDFVVNYYTRDLDSAQRYTHVYNLSQNDVRQREVMGLFADPDGDDDAPGESDQDDTASAAAVVEGPLLAEQNKRQGLSVPQVGDTTPHLTAEQYCWWDLDGDGYAEPYIITFDLNTGKVRRIVARFLPSGVKKQGDKVYEITPVKVFTKFGFIPSPDGGFYWLGLGGLLGPINESVNTAINQMFDAATMSTLGGGFVSRGFRGRGGPITFRPFDWIPVDVNGDDLRKSILPLPVREPSAILFQLATFLIGYGEQIAAANDIQRGENPGQNTPAETTRTLNANGARVYNAIYKRTWRAFRDEFRIQYDLNKHYLTADEDFIDLTTGQGAMVKRDDYMGPSLDVRPAADPYIVSDTERVNQAQMLVQASNSLPGYNRYQAGLRWLKAMKVPNIEEIYPQPMTQGPNGQPQPAPDFQPPPDPKMMEIQLKQQEFQLDTAKFQSDQSQQKITLLLEIKNSQAKIENLQAQAALFVAQAKSEETEPMIKLIYAQIESENAHKNRAAGLFDTLMRVAETVHTNATSAAIKSVTNGAAGGGGVPSMAGSASNAATLAGLAGPNNGSAGGMAGGGIPIQ